MAKKKIYDSKTGDYIPTFEELGYTLADVSRERSEEEDRLFEKEYDERLSRYQRNYEIKRKEIQSLKERVKKEQAEKHWYNTLPQRKLEGLIEASKHNSEEILDYFMGTTQLESMQHYYNTLRTRIKTMRPQVTPVDSKKVLLFPKYDVGRDVLFGSRYSFMKLWSHVYRVQFRKPRSKQYGL